MVLPATRHPGYSSVSGLDALLMLSLDTLTCVSILVFSELRLRNPAAPEHLNRTLGFESLRSVSCCFLSASLGKKLVTGGTRSVCDATGPWDYSGALTEHDRAIIQVRG